MAITRRRAAAFFAEITPRRKNKHFAQYEELDETFPEEENRTCKLHNQMQILRGESIGKMEREKSRLKKVEMIAISLLRRGNNCLYFSAKLTTRKIIIFHP